MVSIPPCFGSGQPSEGFVCSLCDYSSPCASIAKKFISKAEIKKDVEGIIKILSGEPRT